MEAILEYLKELSINELKELKREIQLIINEKVLVDIDSVECQNAIHKFNNLLDKDLPYNDLINLEDNELMRFRGIGKDMIIRLRSLIKYNLIDICHCGKIKEKKHLFCDVCYEDFNDEYFREGIYRLKKFNEYDNLKKQLDLTYMPSRLRQIRLNNKLLSVRNFYIYLLNQSEMKNKRLDARRRLNKFSELINKLNND